MKVSEYVTMDALELRTLIQSGNASKEEVLTAARDAVRQTNSHLNYLSHYIPDHKVECTGNSSSLFYGVPTLIKDIAVNGLPVNLGSSLTKGMRYQQDSEFAVRYKKSGLVILGSTTMPEFGSAPITESISNGVTSNPWNLKYSPGGSSGGAAAAVASGAVPIAQASDAGGSIRIPAACCGLFGLKPTRARNPGSQHTPFSPSTTHVLSRTVRDSAAMLDALHGPETGGIYEVPEFQGAYLTEMRKNKRGLKVGYNLTSPLNHKVNNEVEEAVVTVLSILECEGNSILNESLDYNWEEFSKSFIDLWAYKHPNAVNLIESSNNVMSNAHNRDGLNLWLLNHALKLKASDLDRSFNTLALSCVSVGAYFRGIDLHVSPVVCIPGVEHSTASTLGDDFDFNSWFDLAVNNFSCFTQIYNVAGNPSMSVPVCLSSDGIPIGVQITAKQGGESLLLSVAYMLEQIIQFGKKAKPIVWAQ